MSTPSASSDSFRFQNNGISYKGMLIGEQDVKEGKGYAICAEAMSTLRSMNTRIDLQIDDDGIKVLEEKSSDVLNKFPVSRISFIARDSSDARAFGLVYGEPGGKYKFYGFKMDDAADQALLAIRDMFQVVFEMKKKQEKELQKIDGGAETINKKDGEVAVDDILVSELRQIKDMIQLLSTPTNQPSFGGVQLPHMSQLQMAQQPTNQNWPCSGASLDALGQQPAMPDARSTPAFGSNGFSDTNPFASAFGTQQAPPSTDSICKTSRKTASVSPIPKKLILCQDEKMRKFAMSKSEYDHVESSESVDVCCTISDFKSIVIGMKVVERSGGPSTCAEAIASIRKAGNTTKISTLKVCNDGIKVLDEKSGAVLHNFPVSKISFIARDSSDARALGLVYREPEGENKFVLIEIDQCDDQAVLAIRDMFLGAAEVKKKQIEEMRQKIVGGAEQNEEVLSAGAEQHGILEMVKLMKEMAGSPFGSTQQHSPSNPFGNQ